MGRSESGYTVVNGKIEGVYREGTFVCEYRQGQRHGKGTEVKYDSKGNATIRNVMYEYGKLKKQFVVSKTPELAFYTDDKPNTAVLRDY